MSKRNIQNLCTFVKSNKASVYAIENRMLLGVTDHIVNGYLKMLAVVLQQANEISESQLFLYQRIIAGTIADKSAEDYLRMALSIEIEDFLDFISEMKNFKYRFLFDAILLSCINGSSSEQLDFIVDFSELLKIEKSEMQYLATVARGILKMDSFDYVAADEIKPESIPNDMLDGYIRLLSNSCILYNDDMTIFQPCSVEDVDVHKLNTITHVNTPKLKLHSVKVDLNGYPLLFSEHKKVVIDGCEFLNGEKCLESAPIDGINYNAVITFDKCDEIIISNSVFRNFKSRPIRIISACKISIINTRFENCFHEIDSNNSDWLASGAVIRVDNMQDENPIIIDGCVFDKCGGKNRRNYYRSQFICNYNAEVHNTKFSNCWHYHSDLEIDPQSEKRTMFAAGSKSLNCFFDNCATFCE